ncbi:hypothetical protein H311_00038 [Anncaliia algerae PRA109]|nr:hypothetical protein H311_00038 [Anncaliia algerae PRA109]
MYHNTLCHKYEFNNSECSINTQNVEIFHKEMKLEIKLRKEVRIDQRENFIREFCFYFNSRRNYFVNIMRILKI